jgi:hypothetical protein
MVPVAGLSAITDFTGVANGVVGVSTVSFEHAVAGGPAVNVLPAVEAFLLLVVSLLILMSLFLLVALHTGLQNETYYTIGPADYGYQTVIL